MNAPEQAPVKHDENTLNALAWEHVGGSVEERRCAATMARAYAEHMIAARRGETTARELIEAMHRADPSPEGDHGVTLLVHRAGFADSVSNINSTYLAPGNLDPVEGIMSALAYLAGGEASAEGRGR